MSLVEEDDSTLFERDFDAKGGEFDESELQGAVRVMSGVDAVGHRVVHGGPRYPQSVRVDPELIDYLGSITDLAPLHLPASLAGIAATRTLLPRVPAVACFDTAFHSTMPAEASTYAVPLEWQSRLGVRRFGFHGFSHAYASRRAAEMLDRPAELLRTVTCHLGAGASLAAVLGGRSVDTTMGFTPMEGLVMATRSGSVDPGIVLWLQRRHGMTEPQLTETLDSKSGLLALAGVADMREVLRGVGAGVKRSRLALDVYLHRLRAGIAAMAAAMNGLDALVFTGGVGEHAPAVRAGAVSGLRFLGLDISPDLNADATGDHDISTTEAEARTLVVRAREDVEVAREVRRVLSTA
ncbi:MAG TPA: acetate/propionate family kinase [Candidatus Dormibacteraeota bacterium]|nr:acetate/propionate family kinase [Candidatus Dormibacteraeota bacterium]